MSTLRSRTDLGIGHGSKLRLRSKESCGPHGVSSIAPNNPTEGMLMPILNQYKTLHNLPKEQMKSPQIRKILRKYQDNHLQTNQNSILESGFL